MSDGNKREKIQTRMGGCFPGSRAVFRGHDLHAGLKEMDWIELYVFGFSAKRGGTRRAIGGSGP